MKLPKLSILRAILTWPTGRRDLKPTDETIDFYFAYLQNILRVLVFQSKNSKCVCGRCKKLRSLG